MSSYLLLKIISIVVMMLIIIVIITKKHNHDMVVDNKEIAIIKGLERLEYTLLPYYVESLRCNPDQEYKLICKSIWLLDIKLIHSAGIDLDEIACEIWGDLGSECVILYEFPKASTVPLAKFGAVYINRQKNIHNYYTLKKTGNAYMLCSPCRERQINYEGRSNLKKEEFIKEICNLQGIDEEGIRKWRSRAKETRELMRPYSSLRQGNSIKVVECDIELLSDLFDRDIISENTYNVEIHNLLDRYFPCVTTVSDAQLHAKEDYLSKIRAAHQNHTMSDKVFAVQERWLLLSIALHDN